MLRLLLWVALLPLSGCVGSAPQPESFRGGTQAETPAVRVDPHEAFSQVGEIRVADLPPEGRRTLQLIERGGPFPYPKDGAVFGNRERLLPAGPRGYYREYTVPTPGARNRGARRIVAGSSGEYFYTDDHYRSFMRIRE